MTKLTQWIIVGLAIITTILLFKVYKELTYMNSSLYDLRYRIKTIEDNSNEILQYQDDIFADVDNIYSTIDNN